MGGKLLVSQEMAEISLPEALALDASRPS
jgi:hypothetical protein